MNIPFEGYYRLDKDKNPVPTHDIMEWGRSVQENKRVAEITLANGTWISTVFLGIDHQYGDGPPLLFETMVFPSVDKSTVALHGKRQRKCMKGWLRNGRQSN